MQRNQQNAAALFIGDIALDEYFSAPVWPRPGDKGELRTLATYMGGSIANAARVHAKLGGQSEFVSLLNHSSLTPRLLADLDRCEVGYSFMLYDDDAVDQRNLIFLVEGEHVVFTPDTDELPMHFSNDAFSQLAKPGFVYTTLQRAARLRSPGRSAQKTVDELRACGRKFVFDLDVNAVDDGEAGLLQGAYLVMMNDRGFEHSFNGTTNPQPEVVAPWLEQHEVHAVLHSRSADGARLYTRDGVTDISGYSVDVVDVTGAGDTLGGSLVWALGAGFELVEAVQFGVAAASRSVMHLGPQGGVASRKDIDQFIRERSRVDVVSG